ncbi:hypothetical protein ACFWIB_39090 [Streptomyces sp. NPDC127051]|uniref:hypothetical protein n=1 Tax=Streptomyces sp. NPDC127051 TaxID=3347119 RepID=UPI003668924A
MRKRLTSLAVAIGLALTAGLTFAAPAQAATGVFAVLTYSEGPLYTLTNPDNGVCYHAVIPGSSPIVLTNNFTDTNATLYSDSGCNDNATSLAAFSFTPFWHDYDFSYKMG